MTLFSEKLSRMYSGNPQQSNYAEQRYVMAKCPVSLLLSGRGGEQLLVDQAREFTATEEFRSLDHIGNHPYSPGIVIWDGE